MQQCGTNTLTYILFEDDICLRMKLIVELMLNQNFEKKHSSAIAKKTGNGNDGGRGRPKLMRNIAEQMNMNLFIFIELIALDRAELRKKNL